MPDTFPFGQDVAWTPSAEQVADTSLARFWQAQGLDSYEALKAWALDDVGRFWEAVLVSQGIEFFRDYDAILDTSAGVERPMWCRGGQMNIVHNLLDRYAGTETDEHDAIRWTDAEGVLHALTYRDLRLAVAERAAGLRRLGLKPGDVIGLYQPMDPEVVTMFLAVIRMGGVVLPLFSGYGAEAVATRLQDAGARALVVADGQTRRGRTIPMKPTADEALAAAPSVEFVLVDHALGLDVPTMRGRDVSLKRLQELGRGAIAKNAAARATEVTDAEAPMMLIYTSGTTGKPKGAVHTHCGFPIKAAQDMAHPMDLRPGDVMHWVSDMGWMMGPWLVFGTLLNRATMSLYAETPDYPDAGQLWRLAAQHGVTHLGLSPTLVRALRPHGTEPLKGHDLSALRAVGSTGSPWDPESWRWLFRNVLDEHKPILNYSGGTEISGGIVCGNFVEPLKPCGFSGPVVGMDADVVDEAGEPVRGAVGELVIRQPWIGMTRGFWNDDERYLDSYWRQRPGVWTHGDFAAVDTDGQWFILGRSDDTIKVAGKRLGPAEVEAVLNAHPRVLESAAVGVPHEVKGQAIVAFVVLDAEDRAYGEAESRDRLRAELTEALVSAMGKALKPQDVRFARALPKTRNAKVMRRVARAAYLGTDLGNVTALEDPAAVDAIREAV